MIPPDSSAVARSCSARVGLHYQPRRDRVIHAATLVILALASIGSLSAQVIFSDNFNSGPSPSWGNERGNWAASGGVYGAQSPTNNPPDFTSLPFNLTNFTLDVDINQISDGGIWLRTDAAGLNGILLVTGGKVGEVAILAGSRARLSTGTSSRTASPAPR